MKNAKELMLEYTAFSFREPKKAAEMFAEDGGLAFMFAQRGNGPAITQAEINRVIQTVRKISEQELSAGR